MKTISLIFFCLLFIGGCGNKVQPCVPITKVEYVEVKVPVVYTLKRPSRPKLNDQPIPIYVKELTTYAEILEFTIDKANQNKGI